MVNWAKSGGLLTAAVGLEGSAAHTVRRESKKRTVIAQSDVRTSPRKRAQRQGATPKGREAA